MTTLSINKDLNGIELYFNVKPANDILTTLKNAGFRWHNVKKCWYAKQTAETMQTAEKIIGTKATKASNTNKASKKLLPLFERCDISKIPNHKLHQATKTIAAETRKHLKEQFPEIVIGCHVGRGGWSAYNEVIVEIKSGCYKKDSEAFEAIEKYIKAWLWSYNYDNSDSMTDYFDRGFYEEINTYNYQCTEPTPEQVEIIAEFEKTTARAKEAEETRLAAELEEERKRLEKEAEKAIKAEEIRKIKHAEIMQNVKIKELAEDEKYIISGFMRCGCGKECNIQEVNEYGYKKEESAIIKREIYFTDSTIYNDFCNMFLYDFDFLSGCGGTGTFDNRINGNNMMQLNQEQRNSVKWYLWDCVAVYFNNELKLIIDPEGYNYARYVNVIVDEYTKVNAKAEEEKAEAETKPALHMPEKIATQAEALAEGDYTIISVNPWTLCASMKYIRISKFKITKYAQYQDSLYIKYTEKGKRKTEYIYFHDGNEVLIYSGFISAIPEEMTKTKVNNNLYRVNNAGACVGKFIIEVAKYYEKQGIKAIINTLQY